jgi:hypothetical protein
LILARPKVLRLTEAIPEMSNKTELQPTLLDLSFTPCLEQVSTVRRFLEDYYQPLLNDPDLLCRMAIAIHELLENASKYSARGASRLQVSVTQNGRGKELSVKVSNIPAPEHIGDLRATVAGVTSPVDAAEAYQLHMVAAALRGEGSGLGLARIRAEADMILALTIDATHACVEAVAKFDEVGQS